MTFTIKNNIKSSVLPCLAVFTALFVLFAAYGCGRASKKYYVRPDFNFGNIRKIAVLPIENYTNDNYAGEKIRKAVITEVLSRGVDVIEPGEVTKALTELKIKSLGSVAVKDIQNIQKTMGVEAVMLGAVEAFGRSTGISVAYPEVSIHLLLIDAATGDVVWSAWTTSGGPSFWMRHFGSEGMSLSEAARKVVKETIDTLF